MSSVFVLLFLCLSMHACNARLVGFNIHKESGSKACHSVDQDAGKVLRLSETSKKSIRPTISEGCQAQQIEVKNAETVTHEQVHASEPTTGDDTITTLSSQIDQQNSVKMKGLKRHTRSLMGSATHDNEMEEDKDPKGNEAVEDVGVMDYAQPHRKPPIHNEKP